MLQKRWANYIAERLTKTHTDYSQRHNPLESLQMTQKKRFHLRNRAVLDAASGATAGCVARFVVGPLDVVKIRFQVRSVDTMKSPSPPPFPHRRHCFNVFRQFSACASASSRQYVYCRTPFLTPYQQSPSHMILSGRDTVRVALQQSM